MEILEQKFIQLAFFELMPYTEISQKLGVTKTQLTEWTKKHRDTQIAIGSIRNIYRRKNFQEYSFRNFYDWYNEQEKRCYYCGITLHEIKELLINGKLYTKRLKTRGKSLEIERVLPNEHYDNVHNLRFCCYWCNNAKSDEFSEEEFKEIAGAIAKVWEKRR